MSRIKIIRAYPIIPGQWIAVHCPHSANLRQILFLGASYVFRQLTDDSNHSVPYMASSNQQSADHHSHGSKPRTSLASQKMRESHLFPIRNRKVQLISEETNQKGHSQTLIQDSSLLISKIDLYSTDTVYPQDLRI
jgi:hypothetical protein